MYKMAKKLRQMLTMLLAVSMLAGTIPMNAFATKEEFFVEEQTESEKKEDANSKTVDEISESEIDSNQNSGNDKESQILDENPGNSEKHTSEGSQEKEDEGLGSDKNPDNKEENTIDKNQETDSPKAENGDEKQPQDDTSQEDEKQSQDDTLQEDEKQSQDDTSQEDEKQSQDHESEEENQQDSQLPGSEEDVKDKETETSGQEKTENTEQEEIEDDTKQDALTEENEEISVSGNQLEILEETTFAEEEKTFRVTFSIPGDFDTPPVKIIQVIENEEGIVEGYKEVENYETTAVSGKDFKFKLEKTGNYKVAKVNIGNVVLHADSKTGVYKTEVDGDSEIMITMRESENYDVTFVYDSELVYGLKVKMDRKDVSLDEDNIAVKMQEDSVISFDLKLDESARVDQVTANGKKVKAEEGSTYSYVLDPLEKATVVNIETSLDPKKCNILDVHIWGHSDSVSVKCDEKKYGNGNNSILTKEIQERVTLHVDPKYIVERVLLNDIEETVAGTYAEFDVNFSNQRVQTMVVYTVPKSSTEEKKIVFANKSSNITYSVNTKAPGNTAKTIVTKDPLKQNTYTVDASEPLMEFSVTYKEGYKAKVTLPEGVLYDVTSQGNTDTYSLALATLGNKEAPTEVIIEEVAQVRTISVIYDANGFNKVEAIENGKYVTGEKTVNTVTGLTTLKYTYVHGSQIVLQTETTDDFILGVIKETQGEYVSKIKPGKKSYSYNINVDGDKTIEIELKGVYTTEVFEVQGSKEAEITAENNVYTVEAGRRYKLLLYNGKEKQEIEKESKLKSGSAVLNSESNPSVVNSENLFFEIPANQAGKTLTLEVLCQEKTKQYTHKVQLKVLPVPKITKISGVSNGKLSQTADTQKEYAITCNLPLNTMNLAAEITTTADNEPLSDEQWALLNEQAKKDFTVDIKDNLLKITVNTLEKDQKAFIKIYVASKTGNQDKNYIEGGTFTITSTAPALTTATPTVSLKSATNLDLILSLGMKGLAEIENRGYWYKIEGTPKYAANPAKELTNNTRSFVEYIKYTSSTQVETIRVIDRAENGIAEDYAGPIEGSQPLAEGEFAYKADYNIKVTLVQTKDTTTKPIVKVSQDGKEEGDDSSVVLASKTTREVIMSTKAPAYETNLNIKMVKNTVYSGQRNVVVATPVFSKGTSYQQIKIESLQKGIEAVSDKQGNIMVSVGEDVKPGKYTIEVTADAPKDTLPSKKAFTIEVVQGIYHLTLETPKKLYKHYNVGVSFKAKLIYNHGDQVQPKTKKVEWGLEFYDNGDWVDFEHPYGKFFTIKDGTVTIDKSFVISNDSEKNKFRIKVAAKDYEREKGREIIGYSDCIEITNEKITMGELVLVKQTDTRSTDWEVTARSGANVSVDKVDGSRLAILKKGIPERDKYQEDDFVSVEDELLTYSCNNQALKITECTDTVTYRTIETEGIASKVQITVAAADESNVRTVLSNLTITYADSGNLGVVVTQGEKKEITIMDSFVTDTKKFYGAKDTILQVRIKQQNEKGHEKPVYGANYTLKVQGAKVIESNQLTGEYVIVGAGDTVVLQLTNNTLRVTKKFTLENDTLANQEVKKNKAIKLMAEGSLKTGEIKEEQRITYNLPKECIGKYTYAYVTVDTLDSLDEKKATFYNNLVRVSKGSIGNVQKVGRDGKIVISLHRSQTDTPNQIPEENFTYKLNIMVGTMTDNYEFKAEVKPNAVTLKTTVGKIVDAKLNTTYNMSVKEGGVVSLTLNNKKTSLVSVGEEETGTLNALMNRNISGRENQFTKFFEMVKSEEDGSFNIRLKEGIEISEIGANDWKGYINQYTYTDGTKEKTVYNTAIEIKKKDLIQKYTLTKAAVLSDKIASDPINTHVNLMAGGQVVNAGYVYVPEKIKVSNKWKDQIFEAFVSGGALNIVSKSGATTIAKNNTFTLYVVPEYSYYDKTLETLWSAADSQLATEEDKAEYAKAMETYGIKLTATVEVKEKAKATGKIKLSGSNLTYSTEHFVPEDDADFIVKSNELPNLDATYNDGTYVMTVPYTKVVDWDVKSVSNEAKDSLVKVQKTKDEDSITLMLNKADLRDKFKTDSRIYGKKITIKAIVDFEDGAKQETLSLSVTLPKQPLQLKAASDSIKKIVWTDLDVIDKKLKEDGLTYEKETFSAEELILVNQHLIEEKIEPVLGKDGDLVAVIQGVLQKAPTLKEEGCISYTIMLKDLVTEGEWYGRDMVKITLDKLFTAPSEFKNELQSAMDYWKDRTQITNLISPTEIVSNIRKRVLTRNGDTIHKHLRLYAKEIKHVEATEEAEGCIEFTICITDVLDHKVETYEMPFKVVIPKLLTMEEAKDAIEKAVAQIEICNADLADVTKKKEKTEEILKAAEKVLKGQDYFVEVKRGSELLGTPANGAIPGSASIKLQIIHLAAERTSDSVLCEFSVW